MLKTISRNVFILFALGFAFSAVNISAQNRADEPSVGGSSKKAGKSRTYKKARVLQPSTAKKIVKIVEALERQKTIRVPDPLNEGQFIEKEEDDPDFVEAKFILTELFNRKNEMINKFKEIPIAIYRFGAIALPRFYKKRYYFFKW